MYTPLSNWRHDTNSHRIGSGPNHEGYVVVTFPEEAPPNPTYFITEDDTSGIYVFITEDSIPFVTEAVRSFNSPYSQWGTSPLNPYKGIYFGVNDVGADLGVKTIGPAGYTTAWHAVPAAMDGYWTDYQDVDYNPSGVLSSYEGYRGITTTRIANVKVSTSFGPQYGLRTAGKYTYFGGTAPATQAYTPYNTPDSNTAAQGYTGGGVTHGRMEGGILTNPTNDTSGSRASWTYNPPVYCRTFTETVRSSSPGLMSVAIRSVYRGKSASYVSNYASIYHQAPEGVRVMLRTFSPTVNSSNQRN
jgi:hypothetical protein